MKRFITVTVALAAVLGLASTASALAVLQVSVDPSFTAGPLTLQVNDDGPGDSATPIENVIIAQVAPSTPFNGFSFSVSTGTSNEGTPTGSTNLLLNVQDVARTSTGSYDTLYFRFTDNNLMNPGSPGDEMLISSSPSSDDPMPLPMSVRFQAFGDPNNALFGNTYAVPGMPYTCAYVTLGSTGSCSANFMGSFDRTGPAYSLTNAIAVQLQQGNQLGNASLSTNVTAIPEPASLLLLGSGLAAASAAARRRRAKNARA